MANARAATAAANGKETKENAWGIIFRGTHVTVYHPDASSQGVRVSGFGVKG
jgi:hypothetical protein